jgi:catechol 2,3-dioxygenase-like lactoylglutathione lyase family enzyme
LEVWVVTTGGFTHVHLIVHDIERSAAFYRDALGAEEIFRLGPGTRFMRLPGGDQVIALRLTDEPARIDHYGLALSRTTWTRRSPSWRLQAGTLWSVGNAGRECRSPTWRTRTATSSNWSRPRRP